MNVHIAPARPKPPRMRARAQRYIRQVRAAGAGLTLTNGKPDTVCMQIPGPNGGTGQHCNYARVRRLERRLGRRPALYNAVLAFLHELSDPLFAQWAAADAL